MYDRETYYQEWVKLIDFKYFHLYYGLDPELVMS